MGTKRKQGARPKNNRRGVCSNYRRITDEKHILAYIKHKKGLEAVLKKIKNMLKDVPEDNVLYRQIKNELRKIGSPEYDGNMFV